MFTAQALWIAGKRTIEVRAEQLPEIFGEQVSIECSYSAISIGTEKLVYNGLVPQNLHSAMKVPYQQGSFEFPIKYGYSVVGKITESQNLEDIGQRVHVMHPHQNQVIVMSTDYTIIPDSISDIEASHISNLETAVNAIWDTQLSLGDKVLIVGFGTIGSLVGRIIQRYSFITPVITDNDEEKLRRARILGLETRTTVELANSDELYDVSIHCSGSETGLQLAIDKIGNESKCVDVSWYGSSKVNLALGETFHPMRKQIISSQVSSIPVWKSNRWDFDRRKQLTIEMLTGGLLKDAKQNTVKFSNITNEYPKVLANNSQSIQTVIKY